VSGYVGGGGESDLGGFLEIANKNMNRKYNSGQRGSAQLEKNTFKGISVMFCLGKGGLIELLRPVFEFGF
jgi:hypothetical protein